jgi:tyrosyl-tRNA synthetase
MQTAYIGFDATAKSLHVGSLMGIMMLRWFQETGHRPITLMGGGTTKVGDPSFKDESRKLLDYEDILDNIKGIKQVFSQFLSYDEGENKALMVNNNDWLSELNYLEFIRDYGRYFTINRMIGFESVKQRLDRESPLTFLEFNYMIMQGYDFLELHRRYNCAVQLGGSDQWGNIINGVELGRKSDRVELFALTCPLLTTSSGKKMGKTESGAVWVNADMLPVYDYYQFWRNTEDNDVGKFLKLFTMLPINEITKLEALQGQEINEAKKILAFEATKLCHGEEAANTAQETARQTFEQGMSAEGLPTVTVSYPEMPILDLLLKAGLVSSKGEGRRLIKGGGARIDDIAVNDDTQICKINGTVKLSAGKKKHVLVKVS